MGQIGGFRKEEGKGGEGKKFAARREERRSVAVLHVSRGWKKKYDVASSSSSSSSRPFAIERGYGGERGGPSETLPPASIGRGGKEGGRTTSVFSTFNGFCGLWLTEGRRRACRPIGDSPKNESSFYKGF